MRSSGICTCGHVVLIHATVGGVTHGECLHTDCRKNGCQAFEPALIEVLPDPLFRKGKNHGGHEYIECGICHLKSYNPHDYANEFCGICCVFFADLADCVANLSP